MEDDIKKTPLFRLKTCATSANMGPGFDIAALALDIYNECEVFYGSGRKHSIAYTGPYAEDMEKEKDLVIPALDRAVESFHEKINPPPGDNAKEDKKSKQGKTSLQEEKHGLVAPGPLYIRMAVNIPPKKGLGSSASAVMAGLLIANKAYNLRLNKKQLFHAAAEMESSPDNAAAALSGGMAVVYRSGGEYLFEKIELDKSYRVLIFLPFGTASTMEARELMPEMIPLRDAAGNMGNFSLLLKYLEEGDLESAAAFTGDHIYLKYRKSMYPASLGLAEELTRDYKIPAFISGAGPAVAAILDEEMFSRFKDIRGKITAEYLSFQSLVTGISQDGSQYI